MPKKSISYQDVHARLDEVLTRLQQPDVQVDEAVALYEQGLALVAQLEAQVNQAESTITRLTLQAADKAV